MHIEQEDGETNSVVVTMHVYSDVGIEDFAQQNSLVSVYPNPFSDAIQFEIECKNEDQVNIEIFDRSGKLVFEQSIQSDGNRADFHWNDQNIKPGLYFYKVGIGNKGIETGKILKL